MLLSVIDNWLFLTILFGLLLIVSFVMMKQSQDFYTKDVIVRKFSIMELQLAATPTELVNLIKGLYALPAYQSRKSIAALKRQLKLDFLFMPLAYGCIFLLSQRVAQKMESSVGYYVFTGFAYLQIIPWICDILENKYLLSKIIKDVKETSQKKHNQFLWMEGAKWGIALTTTVFSLSAICYFWLTGKYSLISFRYLLIIAVEIGLFLLAVKFFLAKKKII